VITKLVKDKHASLFCVSVGDDEKNRFRNDDGCTGGSSAVSLKSLNPNVLASSAGSRNGKRSHLNSMVVDGSRRSNLFEHSKRLKSDISITSYHPFAQKGLFF
jgi:hypothetical protein